MMRFGFVLPSLLLALSFGPLSHAQNAGVRTDVRADTPALGDFIAGPARVVLSLAPGETHTASVTIVNREGRDAAFELSTEDFTADASREGSPSFFPSDVDGPFPAREWLRTAVSRVELAHGESATIDVTVRVPANAQPGDHQAALIVTRDGTSQPTGGFTIVSRVASLFIITVEGEVVRDGRVEGPELASRVNFFSPVEFRLRARNDGTVHMAPTGTIAVRNVFGMLVDEIPVDDWTVLRASTRERAFEWRPLFAFGRYVATADLHAFDAEPVGGGSVAFWVIPVLPILLCAAVLFAVSFGMRRFVERFEVKKR